MLRNSLMNSLVTKLSSSSEAYKVIMGPKCLWDGNVRLIS